MRKKTNDKKQKKPMPEYWYNGQPIKDDDAEEKVLWSMQQQDAR